MNKKFQPGDVVQLKFGGPKMTVRGYKKIQPFDGQPYDSDTEVNCEWFDGDTIKYGTFHHDTIEQN